MKLSSKLIGLTLLLAPFAAHAICGVEPLAVGAQSSLQQQAYRKCVESDSFFKKQFSLGKSHTEGLLKPLSERSLFRAKQIFQTEQGTVGVEEGVSDQNLSGLIP